VGRRYLMNLTFPLRRVNIFCLAVAYVKMKFVRED